MDSFRIILDKSAPVAEARMMGMMAEMLSSIKKTSAANSTPAMGALKAELTPAAMPQASKSVRSFMRILLKSAKFEPMAAPVDTIGDSRPAEPPNPTVIPLVMMWL